MRLFYGVLVIAATQISQCWNQGKFFDDNNELETSDSQDCRARRRRVAENASPCLRTARGARPSITKTDLAANSSMSFARLVLRNLSSIPQIRLKCWTTAERAIPKPRFKSAPKESITICVQVSALHVLLMTPNICLFLYRLAREVYSSRRADL